MWRRSCKAPRVWWCWYRRWHEVAERRFNNNNNNARQPGGQALGEGITKALNQRRHRGVSEYFSRWKKAELDIDPAVSRHQKKGKLNSKHESRLLVERWKGQETKSEEKCGARRESGAAVNATSMQIMTPSEPLLKQRAYLSVASRFLLQHIDACIVRR